MTVRHTYKICSTYYKGKEHNISKTGKDTMGENGSMNAFILIVM